MTTSCKAALLLGPARLGLCIRRVFLAGVPNISVSNICRLEDIDPSLTLAFMSCQCVNVDEQNISESSLTNSLLI